MPRDASGTYSQPTGTEAVPGAIASSSAFNELVDDIGDEITNSLARDGSQHWDADQDASGFTVTGLGAPVDASDAATKAYVDALGGISAKLAAIDALTWVTDSILWFTSATTVSCASISDYGRSLINAGNAGDARDVLLLGDLATENTVNNGDWSGAELSVANGGTGASDADTARTNLGLNPYTGSDVNNIVFPIGSYLNVAIAATPPGRNSIVVVTLRAGGEQYEIGGGGTTVTGTWRSRGHANSVLLVQRVA